VICRLPAAPIAPLSSRCLSAAEIGVETAVEGQQHARLAQHRRGAARRSPRSWSMAYSQKIALPACGRAHAVLEVRVRWSWR
jgi:hypothetical protein